MNEQEIIQLLRHHRHDWLNEVQLLLGYTSMGKLEKVQNKLQNSIAIAEQERKLMNLNVPKTALWLISFPMHHDNIRIAYQVDVEQVNVAAYDERIVQQCQDIINTMNAFSSKMEFYEGNLLFGYKNQTLEIELSMTGTFDNVEQLKHVLEQSNVHKVKIEQKSDRKIHCKVTWMCSERGD
ncbi:Spo0B domain-containing protein [Radiobacillus sp. PE A8.2]|uniref:Spo0B domain-containing protein n=1 Tax=Radiobacillus sp. PE A8.2 TaxID=3380349 RepID=UPI00388FD962